MSCGHPPALLRRADGTVESLLAGGLPVGMFEGLKVKVRGAHLRPGDVLLLYTDGVTEAVDREAREFGDKRLIELLAAEKCACATDWIGCVNAAVRLSRMDSRSSTTSPVWRSRTRRLEVIGDELAHPAPRGTSRSSRRDTADVMPARRFLRYSCQPGRHEHDLNFG